LIATQQSERGGAGCESCATLVCSVAFDQRARNSWLRVMCLLCASARCLPVLRGSPSLSVLPLARFSLSLSSHSLYGFSLSQCSLLSLSHTHTLLSLPPSLPSLSPAFCVGCSMHRVCIPDATGSAPSALSLSLSLCSPSLLSLLSLSRILCWLLDAPCLHPGGHRVRAQRQ
jgi:hypothetical protein